MIAGAFMSGGLMFNTKLKQDILIIGLGGGVINNYFTQMKNQTLNVTVVDIDPVMQKIAEKWFGCEESPLHRVIIDDGVRYIHDAARRGEKYDIIIVDLCYNIRLPLLCPIYEFVEDDLIASMRAITANTGTVIVDIITMKKHRDEADKSFKGTVIVNIVTMKKKRNEADKVLPVYARHFPSCYFIVHSDNDKMLFCSAKENNAYYNNRNLHKRFVAVDKALGFQLFLKEQCANYPLE
ncbi:unnamed protein product [Strongylus vulgaris]|uniref:PABS domain-containing protein n=1 Tax=Strongylus vulgaris TaxID=40348 RepID=A0A3P7J738_STRVU|nr:unnamed protein product [Strongylus vulgaris]